MSQTLDPIKALHRYTITSEGASLGYFRLVEDKEGAWVTWAEVERLRAAAGLSEAPAPQWQPIDDAPKDGTWFLCFGALWTLPALGQWSRTANCFQSMDGALWKLTHWMPLPAPPALASPAPPKAKD